VGGKGGVGKTTCAAMTAIAGRSGGRTLIVTTDPASSLGAALDTPVGAAPRAVPGAAGVWAANVDAAQAFTRWLEPRRLLVSAIAVRGTYLDDEDVGRLLELSLPGIDEVIGLVEVVRLGDGFDTVVVDTAPTGHTLRLFAAPVLLERVAELLDALQSHHRAVVSALRGAYRPDAADTLIGDLRREGESLAALLRDERTQVSWVTMPEPMALEETADALSSLDANGIRVRRLMVNRLTPARREPCEWCDARRRFESRALAAVARRLPGREIVAYPEADREPRGLAALRALQKRRTRWTPPSAVPAPPLHRIRTHFRVPKKGDSPLFPAGENGPVPFFGGRWLLFGGKGGVGKTTCAAAAALQCAETRRVLLLSTDPAHSLGDVFGQRFDNLPRSVTGVPNLHVREIDAGTEMDLLRRKYVDAVDAAFGRIARAAGDRTAFRDLIDLAPPGIDEVIAIADVADALGDRGGAYDAIVTDTAPTGHALRLLQTPGVLREWTQALMAILLKYREVVGAGALGALLVDLSKRLRGLQAALGDPAETRFVVVTRPETLPVLESEDLIDALGRLRITVGALLVNAAGRGTCRRCRSIARAQAAAVTRLGREAARDGYAIIVAPAEVPPPHGAAVLRAWARTWRQMSS